MLRTLAIAVGIAAALVASHGGASVYLEDLTSPELQAAVKGGVTIALVPIGGTEQSGPHIALGKHNVRARVLAGRIATKLGNALVAPVIAYAPEGGLSPPTSHMRFPGTLTIPDEAFEATLEYAALSLASAGFRDVVFLGDHGDYQKNLAHVAAKLNRAWSAQKRPARAHALEAYYRAAATRFAQALAARGYSTAEIGAHAGLADTSLALAVDPSLVRMGELDHAASAGRAGGVRGDPRRASAALGNEGADIIVDRSVDAIRKAVATR